MRENRLKNLWQEGKTAINAWLTIPSPWTAEILAHARLDALTIDMQHGLADYQTAISMIQAMSKTDVVPLVRVAWNEPSMMMRLLDGGAYGIVCPMVNTRLEAGAFVGACQYPPLGYRSYGPIRTNLHDKAYFNDANNIVITLAMIETTQALENLDEILSVEGLDGIYLGLVDLSIALGFGHQVNLGNAKLIESIDIILSAARRHDRVVGSHAQTHESAVFLSDRGVRLVTPVNDSHVLQSAANTILEQTNTLIRRA